MTTKINSHDGLTTKMQPLWPLASLLGGGGSVALLTEFLQLLKDLLRGFDGVRGGVQAGYCDCQKDSVAIQMSLFMNEASPRVQRMIREAEASTTVEGDSDLDTDSDASTGEADESDESASESEEEEVMILGF